PPPNSSLFPYTTLFRSAMACQDADDAMERLGALSFVDETSEGLRLHDAVQAAVSARLRALEPERFRELRSAAWRHLQNETRRARSEEHTSELQSRRDLV